MAWVRAEYAREVAVVSTWLTALLPWTVSYGHAGPLGSTMAVVRFPLFEVVFMLGLPELTINGREAALNFRGLELAHGVLLSTPVIQLDRTGALAGANWAWAVAAAVVAAAVVLSLALYADEEGVAAALPVDEVRLLGGLIGAAALVLSVATYFLFRGGQLPVPLGLLVMYAFAGVLLTADRV